MSETNSLGEVITSAGEKAEQLSLDFSDETPKDQERTISYNPRQAEDGARRRIAYALVALLYVIVIGMLALLACKIISVEHLKEFGVVLSPIIALVSAATGFYYGTKSTK